MTDTGATTSNPLDRPWLPGPAADKVRAEMQAMRDAVAKAAIKPFINGLRDMPADKMARELEYVTSQIEELEPWQEALTAAINNPHLLKELTS